MRATLRLVGVDLPSARFKREPYVTSIAVCEGTNGSRVLVHAHPLHDPERGESKPAAGGVFTVNATESAGGADQRYPLTLDVVLYDGDFGGWLVAVGALMDSDRGFGKAGERIDSARSVVDGTPLGTALAAGAVKAAGPAAGLASDALGAVLGLLAVNGDDALCRFGVSLDADGLRDHPREFSSESNSCVLRFHLQVDEVSATVASGTSTQAPGGADGGAIALQPAEKLDGSTGREPLDRLVEKLKPEGAATLPPPAPVGRRATPPAPPQPTDQPAPAKAGSPEATKE